VNLPQDFSPGTVLRGNDLVPEARLSPCCADQFACFSCWFSHRLFKAGMGQAGLLVA
jgi:hypothetical protein